MELKKIILTTNKRIEGSKGFAEITIDYKGGRM